MSGRRSPSSSDRPSGTCSYGMPASSYACRLCGESSSVITRVKPFWPSQISSSWRRILRWLRANPPGRSDAASRSRTIQQKNLGSRPWAQRPRNGAVTARSESRSSSFEDGQQGGGTGRAPDSVDADHRGPAVEHPDDGRERAVVARRRIVDAEQLPDEPL